jgi:hypothetical protein
MQNIGKITWGRLVKTCTFIHQEGYVLRRDFNMFGNKKMI